MFSFPITVASGWNFIDNIQKSLGLPLSTSPSGFFPTPQRETIVSETVAKAGSAGFTYRPTTPQQPSIYETAKWATEEWLRSPFEDQFSVTTKIQESKALEGSVSGPEIPGPNLLDRVIGGVRRAGEVSQDIKTVFDQVADLWGISRRSVTEGTPRAGYPEGRDVQHLNTDEDNRPDILTMAAGVYQGILEQVKGLFNIGYPQTSGQPAFAIRHDIEPTPKTMIVAAVIGAVIILAILLKKK